MTQGSLDDEEVGVVAHTRTSAHIACTPLPFILSHSQSYFPRPPLSLSFPVVLWLPENCSAQHYSHCRDSVLELLSASSAPIYNSGPQCSGRSKKNNHTSLSLFSGLNLSLTTVTADHHQISTD